MRRLFIIVGSLVLAACASDAQDGTAEGGGSSSSGDPSSGDGSAEAGRADGDADVLPDGAPSPDGSTSSDAGTDASADAPSDSSSGTDAGGGTDSGGGSDSGGGTTTTVSVYVVSAFGGARQGVSVVFSDATGALIETKTTGIDGRATSSQGTTPSMVTALLGKGGNYPELLTWTQVEAGDELHAIDPEDAITLGTYSLALPGAYNGASTYAVSLGECGNSGTTTTIGLGVLTACSGALNAPLVAASNGSGVLAYSWKKSVPPPAGGMTTNVTGLTSWSAAATFTVTVQNKPTNGVAGARLLQIANDVATPNQTAFLFDQSNQATFDVPSGYADAFQASASAPGAAVGTLRRMVSRVAGSATGSTFDFAQALPELSSVVLDETDRQRPRVSWTSVASMAGTDGGFIRMSYDLPSEDNVRWTIIVPPGGTSGTAKGPVIPPAQASGFLPAANAGPTWTNVEVVFAQADALADYKAFRKDQRILNQTRGSAPLHLPANGGLRTSEMQGL